MQTPFGMSPTLPSPWAEFLSEVDGLLAEPIELHCTGGFVLTVLYGRPRTTADIDYVSLVPRDQLESLQQIAGEGSRLWKKYRLYFQHASVTTPPEGYEQRWVEPFPGRFRHLRLLMMDPCDLVLCKLERNSAVDREDVEYMAQHIPLDPQVLRERYQQELRPYLLAHHERHDRTLEWWIEDYFPRSGSAASS